MTVGSSPARCYRTKKILVPLAFLSSLSACGIFKEVREKTVGICPSHCRLLVLGQSAISPRHTNVKPGGVYTTTTFRIPSPASTCQTDSQQGIEFYWLAVMWLEESGKGITVCALFSPSSFTKEMSIEA